MKSLAHQAAGNCFQEPPTHEIALLLLLLLLLLSREWNVEKETPTIKPVDYPDSKQKQTNIYLFIYLINLLLQ